MIENSLDGFSCVKNNGRCETCTISSLCTSLTLIAGMTDARHFELVEGWRKRVEDVKLPSDEESRITYGAPIFTIVFFHPNTR